MKGYSISLAIPLMALHMAAQQPSLNVETSDGRTTYHTGEPIAFNLTIATAVGQSDALRQINFERDANV
jgi:hypothetical protein